MWAYDQWTGFISHNGVVIGSGYSGHGPGRNNGDMDLIHDIGPTRRGQYKMTLEPTNAHPHLADPVIRLNPLGPDVRPGQLIHGDNVNHDASKGCIVTEHRIRVAIAMSLVTDADLTVGGDRPTV